MDNYFKVKQSLRPNDREALPQAQVKIAELRMSKDLQKQKEKEIITLQKIRMRIREAGIL